ncbi:MAG: hypothetical protein E6J87_12905 [Deltaproteobacteria bacterium]|nr:MAG: hypothetical protein E6J87_12905 [Deltaproteobacteria bacterium]
MSKLRIIYLAVCLAGITLSGGSALAANVFVVLQGNVTDVQDSPFAPGGQTTDGVEIGDPVQALLFYDNTTAQTSGGFVSYELTSLQFTVPDTTHGGGSFSMVPVALNSATRIVYDGSAFQGLVLPNDATGFDSVDAFHLNDLSFEAEGFNGPQFRFNLGVPVVEFYLPEPDLLTAFATGSACLAVLQRRRTRR